MFSLAWSQLSYHALTPRGSRDFASVGQIVATTSEVLVEHANAARAHELLTAMARDATV